MKPALLCLLLYCLSATAVRAGQPGWDGNYERLHFSIHWLFIPAGIAILEARRPAPDAARFRLEACSNAAVDLLYKVRDRIRTHTRMTPGGLRSRWYRFQQHEGSHHNDHTLEFPRSDRVQYRDHLDGTRQQLSVARGTLDMVTAFFATRALPLTPGETYRLPVIDKDQHYTLRIEVLERERLDTLLGADTPTVKIHPRLQSEGVFKRSGEMYLWFTDDARHLPVRMESEVKYGKVISRLIGRYEQPPAQTPAGLLCERLRAGAQ